MTSPRPRCQRMRTGLLVPMVLAATLVAMGAGTAHAEEALDPTDPGAPKAESSNTLGSRDMELLTDAEAKGESQVTLIVATEKGETAKVAADLTALGGTVANQVDEVGYLRVRVPTSTVVSASKIPGVAAVDLNEIIPLPEPEPAQPADPLAATATSGPGLDTPADNPFMPTGETGAVAFKKAHPTWDGRGVTIGIMDTGIDLDNPALQTTSTGERKIVDWVTETDPLTDGDGSWRAMLTAVAGPTFNYAGQSWIAPAGSYLVNRFSESITSTSPIAGDVNRDGDTSDVFGVLYDPATHDIWVDTNQDRDFTNDRLMRPYAEKFDVGHFGSDNPETPVSEQLPFVVQFREDVDLTPAGINGVADFVNIGIVSEEHGSHVAGITAANDMLGNSNFDGVAPGAKLVSARACAFSAGCSNAALVDGMVDLVVKHHVDVINMSIGGLGALNDGDNARDELYNRLINDYGVQMFISAGNDGPGANTVGDPSLAASVVSVAASVSKKTWLANYGAVVKKSYNMFNFSSRGPAEDGGFKPDISAPGSAISTIPVWQVGNPAPEAGYPLPPGYAMYNGTSMAAPQATGAGALLLSAAKATDRGVTPAALRQALYSSATWIDGVAAAAQGNGLLNVRGAWRLLSAGVEPRGYSSEAPVCSPLSGVLSTPDVGHGIYNRCAAGSGGLVANQAQTYNITVTRTGGPAGEIRHNLSWLGNDGAFKASGSVLLPLDTPVVIPVRVQGGAGLHSAVLRLDDPRSTGIDFEIMNVVVVSTDVKAPQFALSVSGSVDRTTTTSFFITVPEKAPALQVNLSGIATGSQVRFLAINPQGLPVESTSSLLCYTNFADQNACKPQERSYDNPLPGVWEFEVEARRTSPAMNNPFQLKARVQGVAVDPAVVNLASVVLGQPTSVSWSLANQFGPVKIQSTGGPLGSARIGRPSIAEGDVQTYDVVVPAGATSLNVAIGNPSDPGADLDLYLLRDGIVVDQQADGDAEESVTLVNPAPGTYQVEVDGYGVPTGTTDYDYRDVFYSPTLGTLSAPETVTSLPAGGSTSVSGTVTAQSAPDAGRQLFGELQIVTDEGALVGRGQVLIGSVTG